MIAGSRSGLKRLAEWLLVGSGVAAFSRRRGPPYTIVLAYHNVVAEVSGTGEGSLHLPRESFAQQLDIVRRLGDVVPLQAILAGPAHGRPRFAITFDDAYVGSLTNGLEELVRRGMPATYFVAPAFVNGGSFWWDTLAQGTGGVMSHDVRERALVECRGRNAEVLAWARAESLDMHIVGEEAKVAGKALLDYAAEIPGISFGSHTWSHPNLSRLADGELDPELARPLHWLREHFSNVIPWLAYPYGLRSTVVEAACARLGYEAAVLVSGGAFEEVESNFAIPRLNVPAGISARGFELRLSRIFGQ